MHQITVVPFITESGFTEREPITLHECDVCGSVVSDPDLHTEWHDKRRVTPTGMVDTTGRKLYTLEPTDSPLIPAPKASSFESLR